MQEFRKRLKDGILGMEIAKFMDKPYQLSLALFERRKLALPILSGTKLLGDLVEEVAIRSAKWPRVWGAINRDKPYSLSPEAHPCH
jgi:hypothetical protein